MADQNDAFEASTFGDLATIEQTSNEIGFDLVYRQLSKGEYCGQSKIVEFPETAIWRESHNQHVLLSGANPKDAHVFAVTMGQRDNARRCRCHQLTQYQV